MAYPYLPVNPCCTDVVLNTPCGCSSTITNSGCNDNLCGTNVTLSSNVIYNGPALDCIIAEPCDTLNVVLQKIDEIICNLLSQINILNTQVTNITEQITNIQGDITIINNTLDVCCNATTTSTTTAAPTTTTTTTIACNCITFDNLASPTDSGITYIDCLGDSVESTVYKNSILQLCGSSPGAESESVIITIGGSCLSGSCQPTTTTTTTATPTTTTTTTATPTTTTTTTITSYSHGLSSAAGNNLLACAETVVAITVYANTPTINFGSKLYLDPGLTVPFDGGTAFYKIIADSKHVRTNSTGLVWSIGSC